MLRAPVPEAAVDEHRYSRPGEDNVCSSAKTRFRCNGDSVPEAKPVERAANVEFGFGVPRAIRLHVAPSRGT